jgi:type II secretory pathway component GspD/PulD (secretin)
MNRTPALPSIGKIAATLALVLLPVSLVAQDSAKAADKKSSDTKPAEKSISKPLPNYADFATKTYYLTNSTDEHDADEVLIALRNVLDPWVKVYLDFQQSAIVLSAPPDEQRLAQQVISDLDRPRKSYRLTFTLADSDAGKRVGVQHFSVVVLSGQRTTLKEGTKIPVVTGSYEPSSSTQQTQFTYLDVGMNFDLTLDASPNGLRLKSKVEESSVGEPNTIAGVQEPVVRQAVFEGTTGLAPGKPLTLGSLDVPGSTRHIDIEVIAEPLP